MRLAVIIPSYNHARFLDAALESVVTQTRPPDRILVIDDGSKDDSASVIRAWADRGVEGFVRENRGAHNTLNELVGLAAKDCDVVSILNSDDTYARDRFARCLPVLEAHPSVQVVTTALRIMDAEGGDLPDSEPRAKWFRAAWSLWEGPETDLCAWLGTANFPATTSNLIVRTDWLRRFPFRPYRFNHDYYFLAQTVLRDAMLVVGEPLVNYRVHGSNTMNTHPAPLLREMLRMNLDLARDLADELMRDADLRARFRTYSCALQDSISSLHGGLLQTLFASATARMSEAEIEALVAGLDPGTFPELGAYPNRSLVNEWTGAGPVTETRGLAGRYDDLRTGHRALKERERARREAAALYRRLLASRWLAAGRAAGVWKPPAIPSGADEAAVREAAASMRAHPWVRLGRLLGIDPLRERGR